jgi:hypothetical protein
MRSANAPKSHQRPTHCHYSTRGHNCGANLTHARKTQGQQDPSPHALSWVRCRGFAWQSLPHMSLPVELGTTPPAWMSSFRGHRRASGSGTRWHQVRLRRGAVAGLGLCVRFDVIEWQLPLAGLAGAFLLILGPDYPGCGGHRGAPARWLWCCSGRGGDRW